MATEDLDALLITLINLTHDRLAQAASIAAAAKACAGAGNIDEAVGLSLMLDQPLYDATRLAEASTIVKRLTKADC